ncbi:epimerase [Roseobacteraceae bacterium S113]
MTQTALILGPTGRFGGAMADALWEAGWTLRLFDRTSDTLIDMAQGCDVIVNGWNPTYDKWAAELPAMTSDVIAAAQASGARVVFPGNVYVYGVDCGPELTRQTAHLADNPLGRIRRKIEEMYRDAGVPLLIMRAGDYIDTGMSGNWFDEIITKPLAKGRIEYPGRADAVHAWAYLPDLARATVAVLRTDLAHHEEVLFPGYTMTGQELAEALAEACGRDIKLRAMSWWPVALASLALPYLRGVREMRYLWDMPHRIENESFAERLPEFRQTPLVEALSRTAPVMALAGAHQPKRGRGETRLPPQSPAPAR